MAKKIIKKVAINFYEGDEAILHKFEKIQKIFHFKTESKTGKQIIDDFDFGLGM